MVPTAAKSKHLSAETRASAWQTRAIDCVARRERWRQMNTVSAQSWYVADPYRAKRHTWASVLEFRRARERKRKRNLWVNKLGLLHCSRRNHARARWSDMKKEQRERRSAEVWNLDYSLGLFSSVDRISINRNTYVQLIQCMNQLTIRICRE